MSTFTGTSGNDSFTGTSADDLFNLQQGGSDTAAGRGGDDLFNMAGALNAADQINGGSGNDTVLLDGDYSGGLVFNATTMLNVETLLLAAGNNYNLTIDEATVAAGATLTVDASALGAGLSLHFDGTKERDGSLAITGGAGNDLLRGGDYEPFDINLPAKNTFNLQEGGDDHVFIGYNAKNIVRFGATFTAADSVQGIAGIHGSLTVILNGDYTGAHAVTFGSTTLARVDTLEVAAGHSYRLTSNDGNIGGVNDRTLIDGSALGSGDVLHFDGSAQTFGILDFIGGAGNDVLIASSGGGPSLGSTFDLSKGGDDRAVGNSYIDTFKFGAAFTAADRVDGGGIFVNPNLDDIVVLDGNYTGAHAVTFGAKTMVNVGQLKLGAGHSYTLTTNDATVAAGQGLRVDASSLGAGNVLTFNGGAESDGYLWILGGAGNDVLTGGAGNDSFDLSKGGSDTVHGGAGSDFFELGGRLNAADSINGGAGYDFVNLDGDYSGGVTFTPATLSHVEELTLGTGHSYKFTTADGTVSAGASLFVDASALKAGDNLDFDGSAETNGSFDVTAGRGNDTIRGGAGDDSIDFGTHFNASDFFNGGAGKDEVLIDKTSSTNITLSNLKNIEVLDIGGDSYHITTTDGLVSNSADLVVNFGGFETNFTLWFDGSAETKGHLFIGGGDHSDHLVGGAKHDALEGEGGADFLKGGGGGDIYSYIAASDSTGKSFDTIDGFNATNDDLLVLRDDTIVGVDKKVAHGTLSNATFNSDLGAAVNAAHLMAHHAVLFTPDAGSHAGQMFLVIDANNQAGYQAGADYVIRLENPKHIGQLGVFSFAAD